MDVELFISSDDLLGEGPVWDFSRKELLWVDIESCKMHLFHLPSGTKTAFQFDSRLGAAVPVENSNQYLLALQKGLTLFDRISGVLHYIDNPETTNPDNRFNDGKCDPQGRFWIGSMSCSGAVAKGSLYRVDTNLKVTKMLSSVSISNGLAWDDKENKMYYIDTPTYQVVSFDFEPGKGLITHSQTAISVPKDHGAPDGMCIDEEGMLWIAHWGGANISRWNPENGRLLQKVEVPALHTTSCCFGGDELDTLYITSAKTRLSQTELLQYPLSGSVFALRVGVKGKKTRNFMNNPFQLG